MSRQAADVFAETMRAVMGELADLRDGSRRRRRTGDRPKLRRYRCLAPRPNKKLDP